MNINLVPKHSSVSDIDRCRIRVAIHSMRQSGLTYSGIKRYLNFLVEEEEGEEDSIKKAGNIHIHE